MIPTKDGKYDDIQINILEADKLPYGYYMIKIESTNEIIQKYFNFFF